MIHWESISEAILSWDICCAINRIRNEIITCLLWIGFRWLGGPWTHHIFHFHFTWIFYDVNSTATTIQHFSMGEIQFRLNLKVIHLVMPLLVMPWLHPQLLKMRIVGVVQSWTIYFMFWSRREYNEYSVLNWQNTQSERERDKEGASELRSQSVRFIILSHCSYRVS